MNLRSGSQRHRHFVWFCNVPVQAPTQGQSFYTVIGSSSWGGGVLLLGGGYLVLIVQIVKKMERWTKKNPKNHIYGTLSIPHSCKVTPSVDQTKHQFMVRLPNFDAYQKGTRCFRRSFTPVWHCQKEILTPAGTWLRTVETCIICSTC